MKDDVTANIETDGSKTRSETDRMLAGELYFANDPELTRLRANARALTHQFNHVLPYDAHTQRLDLLRTLLGSINDDDPPFIEPPFCTPPPCTALCRTTHPHSC